MKDLQPTIFDDYQLRVTGLIERHGSDAGFPRMESFGVKRADVDDYLSAYQDILDSQGSQRQQLTLYGVIAVLPVIVLSAFPEESLPWGHSSLWGGLGAGLVLALAVKLLRAFFMRCRLARFRRGHASIASYADAVCQYKSPINNH